MSTTDFQFKQFTIHQERTAMKVGTDGVLLGAWVPVDGARRILDVGTGTGLIALMAAQRCPEATIDAVEIEEDAAAQAVENVAASPWAERIRVHHMSFAEYISKLTAASDHTDSSPLGTACRKFDVIVSNPPFFTETLKSADAGRAMARHADSLPFAQLMEGAARLLADDGVLALIYPYPTDSEVQSEAIRCRLYCSDLCEVRTTPNKAPKRLMALFRHKAPDYVFRRSVLPIHEAGGVYSSDYISLTGEFYLDRTFERR